MAPYNQPSLLADEHWKWVNHHIDKNNLEVLKFHYFYFNPGVPCVLTAIQWLIHRRKKYWVIDDNKDDFHNHVVIETPLPTAEIKKLISHLDKARRFFKADGSLTFRLLDSWTKVSVVYVKS